MALRSLAVAVALALSPALPALVFSPPAQAQQEAGKGGWYRQIVDVDFVKAHAGIPPKPDVAIIDVRPAALQYDAGHIPGAANLPDDQFDSRAAETLPADKGTLLIFYCGGLHSRLSHQSAYKAERLGYTNIRVYAAGSPDWAMNGNGQAVSAAWIRKLAADKVPHLLIDARPRRTADKGMIPGAINISDGEFDTHVARLPANKATPLIYYCGGLDCALSDKSAARARALGYGDVKTYPEGYPEWERLFGAAPATPPAGAVLETGKDKGAVTVASFERVLKARPEAINLVDVRDPRDFAAATLRGAQNIPLEELEKRIDRLPADRPTVFFCGSGSRAGEAYDMAKQARPDLPVYFLDAQLRLFGDGKYEIRK